MIHVDLCRTPPRPQASRERIAQRVLPVAPWYVRLWGALSQKGDPTIEVIHCPYCRKIVEKKNAVESALTFNRGGYMVTELRHYCSKQCAEYDQNAHDS
jgi:endogenous inhibitor of DNA gyrase (YacG/DUF329 family)